MKQFPPLSPDAAPFATLPQRAARLPHWPRLLNERMAADYLSIGTGLLRDRGPKPKKVGGRTLWDIRDLDRFADALAGVTLDPPAAGSHASDIEAAWRERREARRKGSK
jgi:hypothetical protein